MKLVEAQHLAEKVAERLRPLCMRIEIAGSIRRGRPEVGDIDLVILTDNIPAVKQRCTERCQIVVNGEQNFIVRMPTGLQLDIFFAHGPVNDLFAPQPSNWPSLLLCRTGSREHNIFLVEKAKALGLVWKPYREVLDPDGYVISGDDESSIYNQLGLPFIEPRSREGDYMTAHFGPAAGKRPTFTVPHIEAPAPPAPPTPAAIAALAEPHAFGESLKGQS